MKLGKLGLWILMDVYNGAASAALAKRVEAWGYETLWIPEAIGREPLVAASWLTAKTEKLNLATGIANIYARDALAMVNAQFGLAEQSGGRFLLGIGVSHAPLVEGMRGHKYEKPIPTMRAYLEAMARVHYAGPAPAEKPKTVVAALGPKMLALAAELADGVHPYNVTAEHTAKAREIIGPDKLLCPELMVILETDASAARAIGRRTLSQYLQMPNYRNNFLRLGFSDTDCDNGGSDKLIDAIVAWGDEDAIRKRIQAHWDAGADHVCIQSLPKSGAALTKDDERIFELLAPAAKAV